MEDRRNKKEEKTMKDKKQIEIRMNNKEDKVMECKEKNYNSCAESKELGRTKKITCEVCGRILENAKQDEEGVIYGTGCNNPDPLYYTVCCDECNKNLVIPIREAIVEAKHIVEEGREQQVLLKGMLLRRNKKC